MMDTVRQSLPEEKTQEARRLAEEMLHGEPDWVRFYRDVLGVGGVIDQLFPTFEQRSQFEKTAEYVEIQQMLAKLRDRSRAQKTTDEPTRVITVRLPQSLHEALRHEAHNYKTSMNKLCISKLLQVVANDLVPSDFERREDEDVAEPARPVAAVTVPAPAVAAGFSTQTYAPQPQPAFHARPLSAPSMPGGTNF